MHPLNNHRVRLFLKRELGQSEPDILRWYRHWVACGFDGLETILAREPPPPFCFGTVPSLADACLVPQLYNARRFDCDLSAYPRLLAVERACNELQAFCSAEPRSRPDYPRESRA
jgi:maleylacetoacetate isomerase